MYIVIVFCAAKRWNTNTYLKLLKIHCFAQVFLQRAKNRRAGNTPARRFFTCPYWL